MTEVFFPGGFTCLGGFISVVVTDFVDLYVVIRVQDFCNFYLSFNVD